MRGSITRRGGVLTLLVLILATGCASVPVRRLQPATRIDARLNPGWDDCPPAFADEAGRLASASPAACEDPEAIKAILAILEKYENGWMIYWAAPPAPAPVQLSFHRGATWLGTMDVYPQRLGHVGYRVRRIHADDAVKILRIMSTCAGPSASSTEICCPETGFAVRIAP